MAKEWVVGQRVCILIYHDPCRIAQVDAVVRGCPRVGTFVFSRDGTGTGSYRLLPATEAHRQEILRKQTIRCLRAAFDPMPRGVKGPADLPVETLRAALTLLRPDLDPAGGDVFLQSPISADDTADVAVEGA